MKTNPVLVFFDADCIFCDGFVKLLIKADKLGTLRFLPLRSALFMEIVQAIKGLEAVDDSIVVVSDGRVYKRSKAVLHLFRTLGFPYSLMAVFGILPSSLLDWFYALFAKHRYLVFGKMTACSLPPKQLSWRFSITSQEKSSLVSSIINIE